MSSNSIVRHLDEAKKDLCYRTLDNLQKKVSGLASFARNARRAAGTLKIFLERVVRLVEQHSLPNDELQNRYF